MSKQVLVIAGEASGDLHGSTLIRELLKRDPELEVFGIGGDRMQAAGMETVVSRPGCFVYRIFRGD
ncbi:MAG: hypothetical protein U5R06_22750 [candidate division KSB1 bacterium]|nr:hypothetical protein [candidate division KSB1 bacterium]